MDELTGDLSLIFFSFYSLFAFQILSASYQQKHPVLYCGEELKNHYGDFPVEKRVEAMQQPPQEDV